MYTTRCFVPRSTKEDIAKAKSQFAFLKSISIPVVETEYKAIEVATSQTNSILSAQNCVTGVKEVKVVNGGWEVSLNILD